MGSAGSVSWFERYVMRSRQRGGFHGWWIVVLASVALALTGPGQTAGISVFIDPIIGGLDLSRSQVSTAYLIGTLFGAATLPTVGGWLDRFGPRRAIGIIAVAFGVVLVATSGIQGLITLTIAFAFVRLLGQGALQLVATNVVAAWFDRRRGLAMGVTTAVGMSLMALVPIAAAALIRVVGWRMTWVLLGAVVLVLLLGIAILGIVNHPSQLGQRPDGDLVPEDGDENDDPIPLSSYARSAAIRTPMFWTTGGAMAATAGIGAGLNFHQIDLLGEQGLTPIEAAANYLPQTVGTLLMTLLVGVMVDRVAERWVLIGSMALLVIALIIVPLVTPGILAMVYGLLLGSAMATSRTFEAAVFPRLYGLGNLGAIRGVMRMITVASSALGPLAVALGHDLLGGYGPVLSMLLVIPVVVAVAAWFTPLPAHPGDQKQPPPRP